MYFGNNDPYVDFLFDYLIARYYIEYLDLAEGARLHNQLYIKSEGTLTPQVYSVSYRLST